MCLKFRSHSGNVGHCVYCSTRRKRFANAPRSASPPFDRCSIIACSRSRLTPHGTIARNGSAANGTSETSAESVPGLRCDWEGNWKLRGSASGLGDGGVDCICVRAVRKGGVPRRLSNILAASVLYCGTTEFLLLIGHTGSSRQLSENGAALTWFRC